jgi:hypothetical protein
MNKATCSTPTCQQRPVRAHQRRNSAIACAYAFVVDSALSHPNRWYRRKPTGQPRPEDPHPAPSSTAVRTAISPGMPACSSRLSNGQS